MIMHLTCGYTILTTMSPMTMMIVWNENDSGDNTDDNMIDNMPDDGKSDGDDDDDDSMIVR